MNTTYSHGEKQTAQRHTERGNVKTNQREAAQARKSQQPPGAGRGKEQILPQSFCREFGPEETLIWDF